MHLKARIGLSFNGECEEAFQFYERCLNGKIEYLLRWGESPMAQNAPPEWQQKIVHARLSVGDSELLAADALPGTYEAPRGFSILLMLDDPKETDRVFAALAEGGSVRMPLQQTFWTIRFGECIDRFGISWTVNCEQAP